MTAAMNLKCNRCGEERYAMSPKFFLGEQCPAKGCDGKMVTNDGDGAASYDDFLEYIAENERATKDDVRRALDVSDDKAIGWLHRFMLAGRNGS